MAGIRLDRRNDMSRVAHREAVCGRGAQTTLLEASLCERGSSCLAARI